VRAVNARRLGASEFRDVTMTIGSGPAVRLLSLRVTGSGGTMARTLVCLVEPEAMRNINYLMTERRGSVEHLTIDVFLPYGGGTSRRLEPERRREGALGSDFAYDDLRTWLYEEGHRYELLAEGTAHAVVRGSCESEAFAQLVRSGEEPFDLWVDTEREFVERVDYLGAGLEVTRRFTVADATVVRGVTVPTRMEMDDLVRRHSTRIDLHRTEVDLPVDERPFTAPHRREAAEYLMAI
jgi:hypothetical protein